MDADQTESDTKTDEPLWIAPSGSDIYQIFIECPDGTIETLNVENHNKIRHVKLQIQTITNSKYLVSKQKLFFDKKELNDTQTLTDVNVLKNCTLQLSFDKISIYIETQKGNIIHLLVKPDESIADIKKSIQERAGGVRNGFGVNDQKLFNRLNEQELTDNDKMIFLDYGLIQNSLLYVTGAQIDEKDTNKKKTGDNMSSEGSEYSDDDSDDTDDGIIIDTRLTNSAHKATTRGTRPRPRRAQTLMVSKSTQRMMREVHRKKHLFPMAHDDESSDDTESSEDDEIEQIKRRKKRKPKRKKKPIISIEMQDDMESDEDLESDDDEAQEDIKRHRKRKPKKGKKKPVISIVTNSDNEIEIEEVASPLGTPLNMDTDEEDDDDDEFEVKRRKKRKPRKSKKNPMISLKTNDLTPTPLDFETDSDENEIEKEPKRRKKRKPPKKKKKIAIKIGKEKEPNFNLFGDTPLHDDDEDDIHKLLQEMQQQEINKTPLERPQSARPYSSANDHRQRPKSARSRSRRSKSRKRSRSRSKSKKRKKRNKDNKYADFFSDASEENREKKVKQRPVSASTHSFKGFFGGAPNASVMDKINAAHSKRRVSTLQKPTITRNLRSRSFIAPNPKGVGIINKSGENEKDLSHNLQIKPATNDVIVQQEERGRKGRRARARAHTLVVSKSAQSLMKEEHQMNRNNTKWIIYEMNLEEEYQLIWSSLQKTRNGKVNGATMKPFMEKSKLKQSKLSKIWSLSDVDRDGKMSFEEFALCLLLMNEAKKGSKLPKKLAPHYVPPFFRGQTPMKSASKRSRSTKPKRTHLAPAGRNNNTLVKRRSEMSIHPSLMNKNNKSHGAHSQSSSSMHALSLIASKSANTANNQRNQNHLRLRHDMMGSGSSMSSMSSSSSSSSDIEPEVVIPDEIKRKNLEDKRMSALLHEINMDQLYESEHEQKEFKRKRQADFDDLFDGLFSDESSEEEISRMPPSRSRRAQTFTVSKSKQMEMKQQHAEKKHMTIAQLLKLSHIKRSASIYKYFADELQIQYAYEMVDHLPKSITQPAAFKSTKIRMLLNKMSKLITKQVVNGEWNGKYAKQWAELSNNRMSYVYGQAPILLIEQREKERKKREKLAEKYVKSETIYFENELDNKLNVNKITLKGNNECFVNKKLYCNTSCTICVSLDEIPSADSSYHEAHIVQIGIAFYDRQSTQYDSVYITDRCGIYRNDAYLAQLSLANSVFFENGSTININCDIQRTESIVKFEHYAENGKLHRENSKQISLDILQYTKYYCKIFIHQFYGNGSYSIYQLCKNPNYRDQRKKMKPKKKKSKKKKAEKEKLAQKESGNNKKKIKRRQSV